MKYHKDTSVTGYVENTAFGLVTYHLNGERRFALQPCRVRVLANALLEAADAAEFEPMFTEEHIDCLLDVAGMDFHKPSFALLVERLRKIPKGNT